MFESTHVDVCVTTSLHWASSANPRKEQKRNNSIGVGNNNKCGNLGHSRACVYSKLVSQTWEANCTNQQQETFFRSQSWSYFLKGNLVKARLQNNRLWTQLRLATHSRHFVQCIVSMYIYIYMYFFKSKPGMENKHVNTPQLAELAKIHIDSKRKQCFDMRTGNWNKTQHYGNQTVWYLGAIELIISVGWDSVWLVLHTAIAETLQKKIYHKRLRWCWQFNEKYILGILSLPFAPLLSFQSWFWTALICNIRTLNPFKFAIENAVLLQPATWNLDTYPKNTHTAFTTPTRTQDKFSW